MAEPSQGEIWQFEFGRPDRRRPVLILTRQEVLHHLSSVTVAPITRTIRGLPNEAPSPGRKDRPSPRPRGRGWLGSQRDPFLVTSTVEVVAWRSVPSLRSLI